MKKVLFTFAVVTAIAGWASAEVGDLTRKSCPPGLAITSSLVHASDQDFAASAGAKVEGVVNAHATIATVPIGGKAIKVAVDSREPNAAVPDVVRFDFTGEGKFNDKSVAPLKVRGEKDPSGNLQGQIGPASFEMQFDGRTIPVTVDGYYDKYSAGSHRQISLTFWTCAEGECAFGEKVRQVRIIDGDGNLKVGDAAKADRSSVRGDTLIVAEGKDFSAQVARAYYGQPVLIDGTWWDVSMSADGKKVSARKADVQTGELKINHPQWTAMLAGKKYILQLHGTDKPVSIPADAYKVLSYSESLRTKDDRTFPASFSCYNRGDAPAIDVAAGKTAEPAIGSPLKIVLDVTVRDGFAAFSMTQLDAAGQTVASVMIPPKGRPQAPVLEVYDAGGNQVYTGTMAFG
jgi:hypothetical protein